MRKIATIVFLALGVTAADGFSQTNHTIQIKQVLIEPFFAVSNGDEPEFGLQNALVSAAWDVNTETRAVLTLGKSNLIGAPSRFGSAADDEFGIAEGFVEWHEEWRGKSSHLRFGLLPLEFGLESGGQEGRRDLSPSLLYQTRVIGLRDFGLQYSSGYRQYYAHATIHNGESGQDLDEKLWITARFGWSRIGGSQNTANSVWDIGFGASTGSTSAVSTFQVGNPSVDTLFDPTLGACWRLMVWYMKTPGFFGLLHEKLRTEVEIYLGQVVQGSFENELLGGRWDIGYRWSDRISLGMRFDSIDPDRKRAGDEVRQLVAALSFGDKEGAQSLIVEGSVNLTENATPPDRLLFLWRFNSVNIEF